MKKFLTREEIVDILKKKLEGKSLSTLGEELGGVSKGYLNDVLKGRKKPSERILKPLGFALVQTTEMYRRIG